MLQLAAFLILLSVMPAAALVMFITRGRDDINIFDKLIIAALLSPLVLVLVSFIEDLLGIPQNLPVLIANLAVLVVANAFLIARYFSGGGNYSLRIQWYQPFFYALFLAVALFRILPTDGLLTPILHDPIAHSEWLKYLNLNHHVTPDQWYPQGLEYYLNYYAAFFDFTYPRIVLIGVVSMVAMFPVAMYYMGRLAAGQSGNQVVFPGLLFLFAALAAVPNDLVLTAGKNSMIFAFLSAPLIFYLAAKVEKRSEVLLTALLCFSIYIIHIPTGIFMMFTFFAAQFARIFIERRRRGSVEGQRLRELLIALALIAVLGAAHIWSVAGALLHSPPSADESMNLIVDHISKVGVISYIGSEFFNNAKDTYGISLVILALAAVPALIINRGWNRGISRLVLTIVLPWTLLYIFGLVLLLRDSKTTGVFYFIEVNFYLAFIVLLMASWFLFTVIDLLESNTRLTEIINLLLMTAVIFFTIQSGFGDYDRYVDTFDQYRVTYGADIEAFEYINNNTSDDMKFLIQIGMANNVIMGGDSGVWIPSYTQKAVVVDFVEFSTSESKDVYDVYATLTQNADDSRAVRELFCRYDIGYIFFGSKSVFFENIKRDQLDNIPLYEKIFDNGAKIYKIVPMDCGRQ